MMPNRYTPRGHVLSPNCPMPKDAGHGYHNAHARGCRCPGPSLDDFQERKRADWRRRQAESAAIIPNRDLEHEARFPAVPQTPDFGEETRAVLNSDDAACRDHDPDLWYPVGTGALARSQGEYAKAICRDRCPVREACLRAALDRGEDWGIWGALGPEERRREKARRQVMAVAA